jgi:hypothetical protein
MNHMIPCTTRAAVMMSRTRAAWLTMAVLAATVTAGARIDAQGRGGRQGGAAGEATTVA